MKRHLLAWTLIVTSGGVGYGQGLENLEKLQRFERLAEESIAAEDAEEAANNSGKAALIEQAETQTTNLRFFSNQSGGQLPEPYIPSIHTITN